MHDPLRDLYERLTSSGQGNLARMRDIGAAWAEENARIFRNAGVLTHLNMFTVYLSLAVKYGSGTLQISEVEANLIKESCLRVCSGCGDRLIEKLKVRARFSRHGVGINEACEKISSPDKIQASEVKKLQELFVKLRDEELLATPMNMHGLMKAEKAPTQWKSAKRTWPVS